MTSASIFAMPSKGLVLHTLAIIIQQVFAARVNLEPDFPVGHEGDPEGLLLKADRPGAYFTEDLVLADPALLEVADTQSAKVKGNAAESGGPLKDDDTIFREAHASYDTSHLKRQPPTRPRSSRTSQACWKITSTKSIASSSDPEFIVWERSRALRIWDPKFTVFNVSYTEQGFPGHYALKVGGKKEIAHEIDVMSASSCPYVMNVIDASPSICAPQLKSDEGAFVSPLMSGDPRILDRSADIRRPSREQGDLLTWLNRAEKPVIPTCEEKITIALADGLKCLHKAGYVHGDVKAENVLFNGIDGKLCPDDIRIANFGLSHEIGKTEVRYYSKDCSATWQDGRYQHLPSYTCTTKPPPAGYKKHENWETWTVGEDVDWCSFAYFKWLHFKREPEGSHDCGKMGPYGKPIRI